MCGSYTIATDLLVSADEVLWKPIYRDVKIWCIKLTISLSIEMTYVCVS